MDHIKMKQRKKKHILDYLKNNAKVPRLQFLLKRCENRKHRHWAAPKAAAVLQKQNMPLPHSFIPYLADCFFFLVPILKMYYF